MDAIVPEVTSDSASLNPKREDNQQVASPFGKKPGFFVTF